MLCKSHRPLLSRLLRHPAAPSFAEKVEPGLYVDASTWKGGMGGNLFEALEATSAAAMRTDDEKDHPFTTDLFVGAGSCSRHDVYEKTPIPGLASIWRRAFVLSIAMGNCPLRTGGIPMPGDPLRSPREPGVTPITKLIEEQYARLNSVNSTFPTSDPSITTLDPPRTDSTRYAIGLGFAERIGLECPSVDAYTTSEFRGRERHPLLCRRARFHLHWKRLKHWAEVRPYPRDRKDNGISGFH
jgi:hypothetical protein